MIKGEVPQETGVVLKRFAVTPVLVAAVFVAVAPSGFAASSQTLPGLVSPSGNIKCLYVPGVGTPSRLLCSVAHARYAAKLQSRCMGPTGVGVDWHGFDLTSTGRGNLLCTGGILYNPATQHPRYLLVGYGKNWRQGVFTCQSRSSGVTCRNRGGHGLFLSRSAWRVW